VGQLESDVAALQEALEAAKKESERQRNRADKMIRMQKQQQISGGGGTGGGGGGGGPLSDMAGQGSPGAGFHERELKSTVDRLLAENAALRSDLADRSRGSRAATAAYDDQDHVEERGGGRSSGTRTGGKGGRGDDSPISLDEPRRGGGGGGRDLSSRDNNLDRARVAERNVKKLQEKLTEQSLKLEDAENELTSIKGKFEHLMKQKADLEKRVAVSFSFSLLNMYVSFFKSSLNLHLDFLNSVVLMMNE
jgi:DNA repair exonuclease SbcCD ATPase subunit